MTTGTLASDIVLKCIELSRATDKLLNASTPEEVAAAGIWTITCRSELMKLTENSDDDACHALVVDTLIRLTKKVRAATIAIDTALKCAELKLSKAGLRT
jgi:hypothetical protein